MGFYLDDIPGIVASRHTDDGVLRAVQVAFAGPYTVEVGNDALLTIQANQGWTLERRTPRSRRRCAASVGSTILLGPGDMEWKSGEGRAAHLLQMRLPIPLLTAYLEEDHDDPRGFSALRRSDGEVDRRALALAARALLTDDEGREVMVRALVAHLIDGRGPGSRPIRSRGISPVRLRRVDDLIGSDLAGVTVARMAAEAGLSTYHFSREFRKELGQSPWDYVVQRRMWTALGLLDGWRPTDAVARSVGFVDASHLGRVVRRHLGTSTAAAAAALFPRAR